MLSRLSHIHKNLQPCLLNNQGSSLLEAIFAMALSLLVVAAILKTHSVCFSQMNKMLLRLDGLISLASLASDNAPNASCSVDNDADLPFAQCLLTLSSNKLWLLDEKSQSAALSKELEVIFLLN